MNENLNGHTLKPQPVPCKVSWMGNNVVAITPHKKEFSLPPLPDSVVKAGEIGEKVVEGVVKGTYKIGVVLFCLAMIPIIPIFFLVLLVGGIGLAHDLPTYGTGTLLSIIILILLFKKN